MISVPMWLTDEHPCSYLDDRQAKSIVVHADFPLDTHVYSQLVNQGFRRSGDQVYRPHCPNCQACVATRLPVQEFQADRSQKRCLKRNAKTKVVIKPARFDSQHFDLYLRYQASRHDNTDADKITPNDYMQFFGSHWCETLFVEFSLENKLMAIAVVDVLKQGLSAVYTFYDPDLTSYSPGVFAVLWQIEQAALHDLDYVYLGFWIKNCRKMRYKSQFQPLFGFIDQNWQAIPNHH